MSKLLEFGLVTVLALFITLFISFSFYYSMKRTSVPVRFDPKVFVVGLALTSFPMLEAVFGIYIYHLPWYYYIVVALLVVAASLVVSRIAQRKYKRDHPDEPTNVKRPTFREAYRASMANSNLDRATLPFALCAVLLLAASFIFHQPFLMSLVTSLFWGPFIIRRGIKSLRQAQEKHQTYSVHWYTQYKILFGIGMVLGLPTSFVMDGAPLSFILKYPSGDLIEIVLGCLFIIPVLASGFFLVRGFYLRRRKRAVE